MNKIAQIFESLEYGPAPESPQPALDWLKAHGAKELERFPDNDILLSVN